jgi:hypothetical protein
MLFAGANFSNNLISGQKTINLKSTNKKCKMKFYDSPKQANIFFIGRKVFFYWNLFSLHRDFLVYVQTLLEYSKNDFSFWNDEILEKHT